MAWIFQHLLCTWARQPTARIWPAKQNHQARSPFTNCSNFIAHLMVWHFMNLPSLQLLALHTYEELILRNRSVIKVLYVVFWAFVMNCENQTLILLKFHKLVSFNEIINCRERNCWWKISTARHSVQFAFGPRLGKDCQHLLYTLCLINHGQLVNHTVLIRFD